MNKELVILSIILIVLPPISATNWYVDNAVSVNGNGSSWSTAWKNFSSIDWASIKPGDTLYISGGTTNKTYYESMNVGASGTAGNLISITKGISTGHNGEVIINGQSQYSNGIYINKKKYLFLSGFSLTGWRNGVLIRGKSGTTYTQSGASSNIIIENMSIYTTLGRGVFIQTSDNVIIKHNYIYTPYNVSEQTDGIYSQRNFDNIYEHNKIIINNVNDCRACHNDGIQSYQDTNITYRYNYIEQNNSKHNGNAQGIYITTSNGTLYAYGNIIYGPNTRNALLTNANYYGSSATMIAYSNTLVGGGWGVLYFKDSPNSVAKNNIIVSYQSVALLPRIEGQMQPQSNWDYNLYYAPNSTHFFNNTIRTFAQWQAAGYDINGKYSDPNFLNLQNTDFRVLSNSPSIDAGANLGAPYNIDKNGVLRPQGVAWDIGAFEYVSGGTVFHPSDLNQNGCIELGEISVYVGLWLNNQGVTLSEVISAVNIWLEGC